jgi:CheY-like chemotaxis protein
MLAYSGKGMYLLEKIHLKTIIDPALDQVRDFLGGTGVLLVSNIQDDLPQIKADANQLRQAVTSVLNNAVEAIGNQQGTVTVSGYCEATVVGKNVILEVADTGCGMDEDTLLRVFDPFFSTKFTGRGLDMSAVSGVVKALNGAIDIQSHQGTGTIVKFIIPACADEIIQVAAADNLKSHDSDGGRPTVLFVDDDELLRDMACNLLEVLGYAVVTADSGREALRIYAGGTYSIDLLMLDMTMPEMDGVEVLQELRRSGSKVPVLLSSGYSRENVSSKIAEDELTMFIQKPYTIDGLKSALEEVSSSHLS